MAAVQLALDGIGPTWGDLHAGDVIRVDGQRFRVIFGPRPIGDGMVSVYCDNAGLGGQFAGWCRWFRASDPVERIKP
jgi:hypothetical protein